MKLTPHGARLLAIIQGAGDWLDRPALAAAMGKKRLNPWDVLVLDKLAGAGLIEAETRRQRSLPKPSHWYRAK